MSETTLTDILTVVEENIKNIRPGQRIKYRPPLNLIKSSDNVDDFNWDYIEELQMAIRGPINKDIFVTLRFDLAEPEFVVDFYRLAS